MVGLVHSRILEMNRASLLMIWRHCVLDAYKYLDFVGL